MIQGSPLVPDNLKRVGAEWASTVIIVADSSRSASHSHFEMLYEHKSNVVGA